jgi:predicted metal-dependent hydrolase
MTSTFTINGKQIRVSVQPSQRARKTLEIRFTSAEEVVVKHPYGKEVDVDSLLEKHRASVERSYRKFLSQKQILDNYVLLVGGVPHRVVLNQTVDPPVERVHVDDGILTINIRESEHPAIYLSDWVKGQTRKLVDDLVKRYCGELGSPSRIFVTETARWGYCRGNGEVIINWQLSCLPTRLAELVILHELVHLKELNHQREFHSKMLKLMPDYLQRESDLRYYLAIESEALNNITRSRTENRSQGYVVDVDCI